MTHQQICRVIPRQALLRRLLSLGCGRLIACRHAGGPACVACTGSLHAAFSEQLRAGARLFAARAGGLLHHSAGDKIITSWLWPCRGGHADMPNVPPHSVERHVWLCSPARYARRFPAFGNMLWPGVFPWHGLSGKSITPMGCGPWPWLVSCCLTVARRCMPSVTCFSPLPSLWAVRPHRRAVPSGISPCQSLWP